MPLQLIETRIKCYKRYFCILKRHAYIRVDKKDKLREPSFLVILFDATDNSKGLNEFG